MLGAKAKLDAATAAAATAENGTKAATAGPEQVSLDAADMAA